MSSMNCASARCSRAAGPRRKTKREPESFAAVSKSSPSGAPTSTWSFTAKSKSRGVPQRRTSTFAVSSAPSGTPACGRFGSPISSVLSSAWSASSRWALAFRSSPMPATSSSSAVASPPLPLSCPICLDSALRRACSSSVRIWIVLRSDSSALKRATSRKVCGDWRASSRATTAGRSLRKRLMSSMGGAAPGAAREGKGRL